jgi:hypothetical protein
MFLWWLFLQFLSWLARDINSNVDVPPRFARYGSNYNLDNVQACAHEGKELETELAINVDGVDDAYLLEVHLEILWKQRLLWKPHYCNFLTWAFF